MRFTVELTQAEMAEAVIAWMQERIRAGYRYELGGETSVKFDVKDGGDYSCAIETTVEPEPQSEQDDE